MNISGKKFVVIGGAGLIGSHTIDKLLLEHVGLPQVLDLAVHLVNFLTG